MKKIEIHILTKFVSAKNLAHKLNNDPNFKKYLLVEFYDGLNLFLRSNLNLGLLKYLLEEQYKIETAVKYREYDYKREN